MGQERSKSATGQERSKSANGQGLSEWATVTRGRQMATISYRSQNYFFHRLIFSNLSGVQNMFHTLNRNLQITGRLHKQSHIDINVGLR